MQAYLGSRYGGEWIVNNGKRGILYVGVVRLTAADQRFARNHIHMGQRANISLVSERYSMTRLDAYDAVVNRYVESHTRDGELENHPFLGFAVSPPDNAVKLIVSKNDSAFWITTMRRLVPNDAFVVQYSSVTAAAAMGKGPSSRLEVPVS
jgi:hypothetical protein